MIRVLHDNRRGRQLNRLRISIGLLLVLYCLGMGPFADRNRVWAAEIKILTPKEGATVMARNPETHLVLRQSWTGKPSQVKVEKTGKTLEPVVAMFDGEHDYLHFRLPLEPGKNSFTILPLGQRLDLSYRKVQADLRENSIDGKIYLFHQGESLPDACNSCHDLQKATIDRTGIKKQISCAVCHQNIVEKGAWQHSTTVNRQCLTCHQQFLKPWRIGFPNTNIQDLCFTCHTSKKKWESSEYIHGPFRLGGCTLCHDPHGDKYRYQLWAEGSVTLCVACHGDKADLVRKDDPVPFVHGIISGKGCVACHDPHASNNQFMLLKPINELCVSCHTRLAGVSRGHPVGGHPVSGPTERRRPGRKLTCTSCHDPHGSSYRKLLIGNSLGGHICIACHR